MPSYPSYTFGANYNIILPPGTWYQSQTNYCCVVGCSMVDINPGANGIIYQGAVTRVADVTDGTSNTLLLGEKAVGWISQSVLQSNCTMSVFWNMANYGQHVSAEYAPNPWRYGSAAASSSFYSYPASHAASSMHPGGVNTAFADGSVHFIKDSINSWPNTPPLYQAPAGYETVTVNLISLNPFTFTESVTWSPTAVFGVWQKLSTRNFGEIVSSDQY